MTIHDIWFNSNMDHNTYVTIWDFTHTNVLFFETAEQLTDEMMDLEIWMFTVIDADDKGINEIHFTLKRGLTA